jgi:hypothetical protein
MKKKFPVYYYAQIFISVIMITSSGTIAHAATCDSASGAVSTPFGCTATPIELNINLYKFALCKTEPTYNDYTDCEFFINSTTPKSITIAPGSEVPMPGDGEISLGTYTYLAQLWGAEIKYKVVTPEFTVAQYGADGVEGNFCYTNGNSKESASNNLDRNMSCTTDSATALANVETSSQLISNLESGDRALNQSSTSGTFDAYLLDTFDTLEVIPDETVSELNANGVTGLEILSSASYLYSVLTLTEPVKITTDTTSLSISVEMTDAFTLGFYTSSSFCMDTPTNCLGNIELSTLGFKFNVK